MFLARTVQNLMRWSDVPSDAVWGKALVGIQVDATTYIDGSYASKICETAVTSFHYIRQQSSAFAGDIITFTAKVKAAERRYVALQGYDGGAVFPNCVFDLQTGRVTRTFSGTPEIRPLGDGWYAASVKWQMSSSNQFVAYVFPSSVEAGTATLLGIASEGLYFKGGYATRTNSYAPLVVTDSANIATDPDYIELDPINLSRDDDLKQNIHRMKSGAAYRYVWGVQRRFKFGVQVTSEQACRINSWWMGAQPVALLDDYMPSMNASCYLINKSVPLSSFRMGDNKQWVGTIELESY